MSLPCPHKRVEIISQDANGKFVECLECREIFEWAELDASTIEPAKAPDADTDHPEGLSDA